MQKQVYAVRLDERTKSALAAAAAGKQAKPRTLAALLIEDGLKRAGYLPREARQVRAQA